MFYLTKEQLPIFLPLGFVGLYRWFWFLIKILAYCLYKPLRPRVHPRYIPSKDVTIVVPTIDSGEEIKIAIRTWLQANPYEIIFVTIPSAKPALEVLCREVDPHGERVKVVTVAHPNKRNQMVAGANRVKTPVTVFCDDDVLWPETMLTWMLAPFEDRMMGGVGTSQKVLKRHRFMTIWEVLAAFRISMRNIEITATTYIDGGVCCLSGRTAAYRTSILRDPEFQWAFTHEFWMSKYHQHSGDDKFLTRWMHSHKWKTYIQACPEAELSSTFKDNWRFLKQLLRWTRNTWRSDTRSLFTERYIWTRHPFVAFTMLDKFFNPITLLAGPATVTYLAIRSDPDGMPVWIIITSYLVWLLVTRLIKYMPHFVRRPQDVFIIPVWLIFNIYFAIMKIYCLFTLHVTDWGTRTGADDGKDAEDDIEIYRPQWKESQRGRKFQPALKDTREDFVRVQMPGATVPTKPAQLVGPNSRDPKSVQVNRSTLDSTGYPRRKDSGCESTYSQLYRGAGAHPIDLSDTSTDPPAKPERHDSTLDTAPERSSNCTSSDTTKTEEPRMVEWSTARPSMPVAYTTNLH